MICKCFSPELLFDMSINRWYCGLCRQTIASKSPLLVLITNFLGALPDHCRESVQEFLFNENLEIREQAKEFIQKKKYKRLIKVCVTELQQSDSAIVRNMAFKVLLTSINEEVIKAFAQELYKEPDYELRLAIARFFRGNSFPTAVPALNFTLLNDSETIIRRIAAETVGILRDQTSIEPLILALQKDPDNVVREIAATSLEYFYVEEVIPALEYALLNDAEVMVRIKAVELIDRRSDLDTETIFRNALKTEKSFLVIIGLLAALRNAIQNESIVVLLDYLKNGSHPEFRAMAAESLGFVGDATTITPLLTAFETDVASNVRENAIIALQKFDSQELSAKLLKILETNTNIETRINILNYLKKRAVEQSIPIVLRLLKETTNVELRHSIITTLAQFSDKSLVTPLLEELEKEKNNEIRKALIFALGRLKDPACLSQFQKLADDPESDIRQALAQALGNFTAYRIIPIGMTLLEKESITPNAESIWFITYAIRGALVDNPHLSKQQNPQNERLYALLYGILTSKHDIPARILAAENLTYLQKASLEEDLGKVIFTEQNAEVRAEIAKLLDQLYSTFPSDKILSTLHAAYLHEKDTNVRRIMHNILKDKQANNPEILTFLKSLE